MESTGSPMGTTIPRRKVLGIFTLSMINVAAVLTISDLPSMAEFGWSCIGWYLIGTVLFLIPLTLAGAELATMLSDQGGGVYAWCREAFGTKGGFLAVYCVWATNLVWFPTGLAFIASTLAYAFSPALGQNAVYLFPVMMIAFWGTTVIAYFGEGVSARVQGYGVVLGSIVPALLIIALGLFWLASGAAIVLPPFSLAAMLPTVSLVTFPFFATVIFLFAGMDMAGFHALETRNPGRNFPLAMALSALIIFFCTVMATLAIALVIPAHDLSLAAGVMQAIQYFFTALHIPGAVTPMAVLITIGGVVSLAAWLIGPAKGLGVVAEEGHLPRLFNRTNRYGAPVAVLVVQAIIGTIVSVLYIFMPSVNQAYWVLTAVTVELLCIVYFLVFASLIKLRYTRPDARRPFKIPGGMPGIWVVGGLGIAGVLLASLAGLLPPVTTSPAGMILYLACLLGGTVLLAVPPFIFLRYRKPGGKSRREEQ